MNYDRFAAQNWFTKITNFKTGIMKKILLSVVLGAAVITANAQEFKPTKGHKTAEFGLTGGLDNTAFDLSEGAGLLRGRYFKSDNVAYRLGLRVENTNETSKVYGTGAFEGKEGSVKESFTGIALNLGIEKHFAGTDRLSPYIGADLVFGMMNEKTTRENVTGFTYSDTYSSELKGPGEFSVGVRAVIGADYYIAKHLYLGVEAGLGVAYGVSGKTKFSETISGTTTSTETKSAGNRFDLGQTMIAGVRIGFVF